MYCRHNGAAATNGPAVPPVESEHGGLRAGRAAALAGARRALPQRRRGRLPALRAAGGEALRTHEAHAGRRPSTLIGATLNSVKEIL